MHNPAINPALYNADLSNFNPALPTITVTLPVEAAHNLIQFYLDSLQPILRAGALDGFQTDPPVGTLDFSIVCSQIKTALAKLN